jgi:hypothetical protein
MRFASVATPMAPKAVGRIRLAVQINDWSLRSVGAHETPRGIDWLQPNPPVFRRRAAVAGRRSVPAGGGLRLGVMSHLPRAFAQGRPYICPVSPAAVLWWMSAEHAAENLTHAAGIEATGVLQPPAPRLSAGEILYALSVLYPESGRSLVTFRPDARLEESSPRSAMDGRRAGTPRAPPPIPLR